MKHSAVLAAAAASAATSILCAPTGVWAQSLTLIASSDNTLYEDEAGALSNGEGEFFFAGRIVQDRLRRGLMAFDLSSVPTGATITSVSMSLRMDKTNTAGTAITLHRASAAWGEGMSDASAQGEPGGAGTLAASGDATWLHRFYNTGSWTTPGGDFVVASSATLSVGSTALYTIGSTAGLVADVQGWVNTPASNFGWAILGNEGTFGTALRFITREASNVVVRPTLTVQFTVPAGLPTWNVNADGSWSTGTNWTSNTAPNGADADVTFGSIINAPHTVTTDSAKTVGKLTFDNANSYTIAGPATITMQRSGAPAVITVNNGTHTISAPVSLASDLNLEVNSPTGQILLTGPLNAAGRVVLKGGRGLAQLENVRAARLDVVAGTVRIRNKGAPNSAGGTSVVQDLRISVRSQLDLTDNSAIVDYAAGSLGSLLTTTRLYLAGNRLITSAGTPTIRLGYADNAAFATPRTTFAGQSVDASSVLIKYTYAGDSDLDGDADGIDIGTWATNFTGELGGFGTGVWAQGDWDYDGDADGVDAGLWATAFTGELSGGGLTITVESALSREAVGILQGLGIAVVPEPVTLGLAAVGLTGLSRTRPRRKSIA